MRVAINHETIYRYPHPASYAIAYLRLTPLSGPSQRVLSWRLNTPGSLRSWTDAYGNAAHVLVLDEDHEEIRISATGEVEIADGGKPLLGGDHDGQPELFLRSTRLTDADTLVRDFAADFRPGVAGNVRKGLDALLSRIRGSVAYRPDGGDAIQSALQTLEGRAGLSHDHAHLFVSCCRSLGVPARYVSGYLCSDDATDHRIASHAWAEAWVDGAGWLSFDIATDKSNAQARVRLAIGLDSLDASPVRSSRRGGDAPEIEVRIGDARDGKSPKKPKGQTQKQ